MRRVVFSPQTKCSEQMEISSCMTRQAAKVKQLCVVQTRRVRIIVVDHQQRKTGPVRTLTTRDKPLRKRETNKIRFWRLSVSRENLCI